MKIRKSMLCIALLLLGLFFMMPMSAMAKGIFEHQDTVVPENQSIDDVVVIGGDATILGTVNDAVIVFNGNAILKPSAKINGIVFVVGGKVRQEHGAVVTDEIIDFSFDTATRNSLLIGGGLVIGTWLLQLAASVLLIILTVATVLLTKARIHPFVDRARRSPGQLLYVGFFSSLILIALTVLLVITLIGIPLALLVLLFVMLAFVVGLSALSILVGEKVQWVVGRPEWLIALTGSILLVSLMNVPFVGELLFLGIAVFSLGIMTLWFLEKLKRKSKA